MRPILDLALTGHSYRPHVRAFLAVAGLLALVAAGAAAAGPAKPQTLRKSPNGPIEAVAQDGSSVAWLASSSQTCNSVHVLGRGQRDLTAPQPSAPSMTCRWQLTDGQPQLAYAAKKSTALWTLHESGPAPFDQVLAARVGGPERNIKRLAHSSNGTGLWLGGVAGAGSTLAYSWDDVEYVDPVGCLSTGSCKQKIEDGGIKIVTKTGDQPLSGAAPALQLAASAGRIAYVPATTVKSGRPSANTNSLLYVVDAVSGTLVSHASVHGIPLAISLSPRVFAVLTTQAGPRDRISWFSAADGTKLGSALVSQQAEPELAASDQLIVYRVGRFLRDISIRTGHSAKLVKTGLTYLGLSLAGGRLLWAENHNHTGRLRALAVGS